MNKKDITAPDMQAMLKQGEKDQATREKAEAHASQIARARKAGRPRSAGEKKDQHLNIVLTATQRAKLEAYKTLAGKSTSQIFGELLDQMLANAPETKSKQFRQLAEIHLQQLKSK